jgi:hypothetical protein
VPRARFAFPYGVRVRLAPLPLVLLAACSTAGGPAPVAAPGIEPVIEPEIQPVALPAPPAEPEHPALAPWDFLRTKYDRDGDARIAPEEYTRSSASFARLDADGDGLVTAADFDPQWDGRPRIEGPFQYGVGGPELGEPAPEFTLASLDGERLSLAALRAERPVVLVFGSFT